jgi:hypothetical protein
MLEHVRQGGKPYDIRGCHITETVNEIAVLSRFNRASANRILEGVTQDLVTEAQAYYQSLRENLKHMATGRGYVKYFESWHPAIINEQEGVVDNIKTLFIEQSIDSRIEAALPLLAKIQQRGHEMKEADIFESWINNLSEGTWNLPETPEQLDKLKTLMTKELIVGPDATNATEQLYDLIGDDELFDRLEALAARDPRANAWNDTEVMNRIRELGIEMPEPSAPGNPAEPQTGATAPVAAEVPPNPAPAPQAPVAEGILDKLFGGGTAKTKPGQLRPYEEYDGFMIYYDPEPQLFVTVGTGEYKDKFKAKGFDDNYNAAFYGEQMTGGERKNPIKTFPRAAADHMRYTESVSEEINAMRKAAGLSVVEGVLTDSTGSTLDHICNRFGKEVRDFEASGNMSDDLYHALYDYYFDDMPYGTKKARDGDPHEWIADRFSKDRGLDENYSGMIMPEADMLNTFEVMSGFDAPAVHEGSCNSTMEGQYCPEHGLAECGGMYEMGTVAGGMAPVIGEGDAVLARIKSLALLK